MGLSEALSLLKERNHSKVIVEMDALEVVHALYVSSDNLSHFDLVIDDCRRLLNQLCDVKVVFVRRSANSVTHCLARVANSLSGLCGGSIYLLLLFLIFCVWIWMIKTFFHKIHQWLLYPLQIKVEGFLLPASSMAVIPLRTCLGVLQ